MRRVVRRPVRGAVDNHRQVSQLAAAVLNNRQVSLHRQLDQQQLHRCFHRTDSPLTRNPCHRASTRPPSSARRSNESTGMAFFASPTLFGIQCSPRVSLQAEHRQGTLHLPRPSDLATPPTASNLQPYILRNNHLAPATPKRPLPLQKKKTEGWW